MLPTQFGDTAYMVGMVMRQQDGPQLELPGRQGMFDNRGFTGINNDGHSVVIMDQPDVVIGECRQRYQVHHDLRTIDRLRDDSAIEAGRLR